MADSAYYRSEADRCRDLAARSPESEQAKRWRQLASEYDQLAETLETAAPSPHILHVPMQQQPTQQQQQTQAEEPDKEG
jgi:aminoglycoside phosphotransferase (APT) family kinase protein